MSANFTPDQKKYNFLPPFKGWVLENFPFIEADFDAITNYQMMCKIIEYLKNLQDNTQKIAYNENEVYNAFIQLQNYVNSYFDNLDVQDEINKKLDEMAQSGELSEIVSQYLQVAGVLAYNTVNDMKNATNLIENSFLITYGFHNLNDGGGAMYKVKKITNTDVVDESSIISLKDSSLIAVLQIDNLYSIKKFGGFSDGITDNSAILEKMINKIGNNNATILIDYGSYAIDEPIIIPENIDILFYGKIINNNLLHINGKIDSTPKEIITGDGELEINKEKNTIGYPEWLGAVPNNENVDNSTYINKTIDLFDVIELQKNNYYISNTIKITKSNKLLRGYGNNNTKIIMNDNLKTIMQVGTDEKPAEVNSFIQDIKVENLSLTRNTTDYLNDSIGLLTQFILYGKFNNLLVQESSSNFKIMGVVATRFFQCRSFNSTLESGDNTRSINGFNLSSNTSIGLAGSNASVYLTECNSSCGGIVYNKSTGFNLFGDFGVADTYISKCEVANYNNGIVISGNQESNPENDVIIDSCIVDAYKEHGFYINNMGKYGNVSIINCYAAAGAGTDSQFSYRVYQSKGNVMLTNNQAIGTQNVKNIGVFITDSSNVQSKNMIYDCARPIVIDNSDNIKIEDNILNRNITTIQEAIAVSNNVNRCYIQPSINCEPGLITGGITFTNNSTNCEVNVTQFSGYISGGTDNYVKINGEAKTTTGLYGTILISGAF